MGVKILCLHDVAAPAVVPQGAEVPNALHGELIYQAGATIEVTEAYARQLVAIGAARFAEDEQRVTR